MMVLKWMEEVQLIDGYLRSCLYDLPRGSFSLVDKQTRFLIGQIEGHTIDNLKHCLNDDEYEWVESFLSSEYVFEVPKATFPAFSKPILKWENPSRIDSAIISDTIDLRPVLEFLRQCGCKHLWIQCQNFHSAQKLLTDYFTTTFVLSIDLHILQPFDTAEYDMLIELFPVINKIHVSDLGDYSTIGKNSRIHNFQSQEEGAPLFMVNLPLFIEAMDHNTYFNRKFYSGNPEINSPNYTTISDVIEHPPVIWYSSKEKTDVCSDCEFRRMCIDKRIPIQRIEKDNWFHRSECHYNPYIAKWKGEEGYRSLAECGIISNEVGFSIDHKRLEAINQELWGEY